MQYPDYVIDRLDPLINRSLPSDVMCSERINTNKQIVAQKRTQERCDRSIVLKSATTESK